MDIFYRSQPGSQGSASTPKKHLVILGAGFGGVYTALALEKALRRSDNCEVTLVSRENYFLFTPMRRRSPRAISNSIQSSIPCASC